MEATATPPGGFPLQSSGASAQVWAEIPMPEHSYEVRFEFDITVSVYTTDGGDWGCLVYISWVEGGRAPCTPEATHYEFTVAPGDSLPTEVTARAVIQAIARGAGEASISATLHSVSYTVITHEDTIPPDTWVSGPPPQTSSSTATFFFDASESAVTFECRLDGTAFSACSSPTEYAGLSEGAHVFEVRATDSAGNTDPSPASHEWIVDRSPPQTTITSGPSGTTASISARLEFASSEEGSSFACSLDDAPYEECSSPKLYGGLEDGTHTFAVYAIDLAGNADPTPASRTWTVDHTATEAPDTTVIAGPSGTVGSSSASFEFEASEAGATFACSLDGGSFASCASPTTYTDLTDGQHTFRVRATDPEGNTDPSPASRTWTVETAFPETFIDAGPSGTVATRSASFRFRASEPASFNCSLDGAAFSSCVSPWSYEDLADGTHEFKVRATDLAGKTDPSPAARTWTISLDAPDTIIDAAPPSSSSQATARFEFHATDPDARFSCSLDDASFTPCTSPKTYDSLRDGSHVFRVRAAAPSGATDPTPASWAWQIDTTAPLVRFLRPTPGVWLGDGQLTNFSVIPVVIGAINVETYANDIRTGIASFQFLVDGTPVSPADVRYDSARRVYSFTYRDTGVHTITARATDQVGHTATRETQVLML